MNCPKCGYKAIILDILPSYIFGKRDKHGKIPVEFGKTNTNLYCCLRCDNMWSRKKIHNPELPDVVDLMESNRYSMLTDEDYAS